MIGSEDYHISLEEMATRIEFLSMVVGEVLPGRGVYANGTGEHEIGLRTKAIGINFIDTYIRSGLYHLHRCCGHGNRSCGCGELKSATA